MELEIVKEDGRWRCGSHWFDRKGHAEAFQKLARYSRKLSEAEVYKIAEPLIQGLRNYSQMKGIAKRQNDSELRVRIDRELAEEWKAAFDGINRRRAEIEEWGH